MDINVEKGEELGENRADEGFGWVGHLWRGFIVGIVFGRRRQGSFEWSLYRRFYFSFFVACKEFKHGLGWKAAACALKVGGGAPTFTPSGAGEMTSVGNPGP